MAIGLYRVEWNGNLSGQFRQNVMHFRLDPEPGANPFDTALALASALDGGHKNNFLGCLPQSYGLDAIVARRIGPTGGAYAIVDYSAFDQLGSRGAFCTGQQLCPCITLIPPMGVKSAGRIFLPAVSQTDIQMNVYLAAYRTAVNAFINPLIAGFTVSGGTCKLAIYSRKLNTSSDVVSFALSSAIGYQRRRAKPVGS